MKKIILIYVCLLTVLGQASAQPSAVQKVGRSVFTLTTYSEDGTVIATSHGFFISSDGLALSEWKPFIGAVRAEVTDGSGKTYPVDCVCGANELYDVAKFRVEGRFTPVTLAKTPSDKESKLWAVSPSAKKASTTEMNVSQTEKFMDTYLYYVLTPSVEPELTGCPLVAANGEVVALLQPSSETGKSSGTSALYIASFKPEALSANNSTLRRTKIRIDLPDDKEQALLPLMMSAEQYDSAAYVALVEAFIKKFPTAHDGYVTRAGISMAAGDFEKATRDMETALKYAEKKDEVHFAYANLIYQKELYQADKPYTAWSLDKAYEEAQKAYNVNPLPIYRHLQAQIDYVKGDYQKAYDTFIDLTKTPIRNSELYYEGAQCKKMLNAPQSEVLELLDSAVAVCPKPLLPISAPYLLARGMYLEEIGEYRRAVRDYNVYDTLMVGRIGADFYYMREQCEVKGKLYKQALEDINRAIMLAPGEPMYFAEKASLLLRVNMKEEAFAAADNCVKMAPEYAEGYLLRGLAAVQQGRKKQGLDDLQKAKELGKEQAQSLIDKYK